ncbi:MAG: extracellular solute-binding protein [Eubacteriales bacterium]|nr:extracellular solute-binding protein [Eubacteriales bacterium]
MNKRKMAAAMAASMALAAVFAGSAFAEEGKQVTLNLMNHTSEELKIQWEDSVVEAFEELHPGVTIEVQRMSYDDYIATLQTKFASGDAPDIYALENSYVEKYVANGYAAGLNDTEAVNHYEDGVLDMLTVDGEAYALPYSTQIMEVTYNKDVFEQCGITEVPQTLEEFYAVCETLQEAGITPIGGAYSETWCLMADLQADYIGSVLMKDGDSIVNLQNRETTFAESEDWAAVLERIQTRLSYVNSDPFGTSWDDVCTDLANGETAMTLNGHWTANNVLAMNEEANLSTFPLPTTDNAEDAKYVVQSPSEGYALNPESANLDLAKEFLDYYTSTESVQAFVDNISEICIVVGTDADTESASPVGLEDIVTAIAEGNTVSLGAVDHNFENEYRDAVQTVVSDFLLNGYSVEECLANLDAEFDRIAAD